ncbi:MAG: ferredoxin--NADP reductase [Hyphomicrobium sp.]
MDGDVLNKARVQSSQNFNEETVLSVHHWTDTLFSLRTTRTPSFRFVNGQFTMMGLMIGGKPLTRAYSMASANYEDELEFFSIKVANGPLTSQLQHVAVGDTVLVGRKPTGTLVIDNLRPGRHLYLLATGTGLAPFLSIIQDPQAYETFEKIVLVHGCRYALELAYADKITRQLPDADLIGDMIRAQLIYYPTVTREPFRTEGRIPLLIDSGRMARDTGLPPLDPEHDRVMLCGSPAMLADLKTLFEGRGFVEGSSGRPADFVIERAFVAR